MSNTHTQSNQHYKKILLPIPNSYMNMYIHTHIYIYNIYIRHGILYVCNDRSSKCLLSKALARFHVLIHFRGEVLKESGLEKMYTYVPNSTTTIDLDLLKLNILRSCTIIILLLLNVVGYEKRDHFAQNVIFWHFSNCHHSKASRAPGF